MSNQSNTSLMLNRSFTKVNEMAKPINDLTISNNLRVGGTSIAGPIEKTLVIPKATEVPSEANLIKITPEQSGTTFILSQTGTVGYKQVLVLPPAAIGLNYTFIAQVGVGEAAQSTISIMPYGYTHAGGNPAGSANGVAEAYEFGIQAIMLAGQASPGIYGTGARSDQVCTLVGNDTVVGGIMFTALGATATLKLTCISTSTTGLVKTGCRWIGTGQVAVPEDIGVSAA